MRTFKALRGAGVAARAAMAGGTGASRPGADLGALPGEGVLTRLQDGFLRLRVVLVVVGLRGFGATALALPAAGYATTTVSTVSEWGGSTTIEPFGDPNTATYG